MRTPATGTAAGMHADEAERDVIGAVLLAGQLDLDAGHRILERARTTGLAAHHFYAPSLAVIWTTVCELADAAQPVDTLAVAHELERRALANVDAGVVQVDWPTLRGRLLALAHEVPAFGVVEHRARLVIGASAHAQRHASSEPTA